MSPPGTCRRLVPQSIERGVGSRHRVVDGALPGNDKGAKGYSLHIDARHLHDRKDDGQRQRNGERDNQTGADTEADEAHDENDRDRLLAAMS